MPKTLTPNGVRKPRRDNSCLPSPDDMRSFLRQFALRGRDPAVADENLYRYVGSNPEDYVDWSGKDKKQVLETGPLSTLGDMLLGKHATPDTQLQLPEGIQRALKAAVADERKARREFSGAVTTDGKKYRIWAPARGEEHSSKVNDSIDLPLFVRESMLGGTQSVIGFYHVHTYRQTVFSHGDVINFLQSMTGPEYAYDTKFSFYIVANCDGSVIRALVALSDMKRLKRGDDVKDGTWWGGYTGKTPGGEDGEDAEGTVLKDDLRWQG